MSLRFIVVISSLLLSLVFSLPFGGLAGGAELSSTQIRGNSADYSSLIHQYLVASDTESAQTMLNNILQNSDATVTSVSEIIQKPGGYSQQSVGAQPSERISVRGRQYQYSLYVPPTYDPAKAYPLIVCLHGAGFTGESYLDRWVPRLNDQYLLVCPTISMGAWWRQTGEKIVLKVIKNLQIDYHIDPNRIFLTGMSNGGIGSWIIGMHHADLFAGIAPMASGIDDVLFPFINNLRGTPVYIIHGLHDQVMPVSLSRTLVNEMAGRGIRHVYQEHNFTLPHAGGHFFPREELPALVSWFDEQKRGPIPQRVSVVRDATHLTNFSWVRIDATEQIAAFSENLIDSRDEFITGKVYAKLDAEVISPNRIKVRTDHVRRYTLYLNDDLVDFSQPITIETNGKRSLHEQVSPNLETLLSEARRRQDFSRLFSAKLTVNVLQ
ncbi:MAG: hypothetical protein ACPGYT_02365 [Nitrospirales bacterium]